MNIQNNNNYDNYNNNDSNHYDKVVDMQYSNVQ